MRLVAFNSEKEYAPYKPNDVALAYYSPGAERDTIVMSHTGVEAQVAVHEYTHLVMEHAGLSLPPWMNEGLAEIFSTLRPTGNKVMIGEIIAGRRYEMLNTSPYYNEKNKAGSLYNEGWALTHMLMLDERYSAKFDDVLRTMIKGPSSEDALATVYVWGAGESPHGPHRYMISAYVRMPAPAFDIAHYYLEDRYMTSRKYEPDTKTDILASEKQEILARLMRLK